MITLHHITLMAAAPLPKAKPITGPWPKAFPAKELCSNCGLCMTSVGNDLPLQTGKILSITIELACQVCGMSPKLAHLLVLE